MPKQPTSKTLESHLSSIKDHKMYV